MHLTALKGLGVVRDQDLRLWFVAKPFFSKTSNDTLCAFSFHFNKAIFFGYMYEFQLCC